LKENVIIGRLIPAGTGLPQYRAVEVSSGAVRPVEGRTTREAYEAGELLTVDEDEEMAEELAVVDTSGIDADSETDPEAAI
jgi:hypothetical protein